MNSHVKTLAQKLLVLAGVFATHAAVAFYDPNLGRWINRDPIEDEGANLLRMNDDEVFVRTAWHRTMQIRSGVSFKDPLSVALLSPATAEMVNLYGFVENDPINRNDAWGLVSLPPGWSGPGKPYNETMNPFCGPAPPCGREAAATLATAALALRVCTRSPLGRGCDAALLAYSIALGVLFDCLGIGIPLGL